MDSIKKEIIVSDQIKRGDLWLLVCKFKELAHSQGMVLTGHDKLNVPGKYVITLELSADKAEEVPMPLDAVSVPV